MLKFPRQENFSPDMDLCLIVSTLVDHQMVMRAGIVTFRFVHADFVDLWTVAVDVDINLPFGMA